MSTGRAVGWGLLIFLYFAVVTVWLVSFAIENVFNDLNDNVSDVLALSLWGGGTAAGMWGLRQAQQRGWFR